MIRKKLMTSEELMAELSADPEYQRKMAEEEAKMLDRMARMADACRPILDNLRSIGRDGESIQDIVNRYAPLPDDIVQVLLHWLPFVDDAPVKETIVRALGTAKGPYAGHALVDCFVSTRNESLKFAVAYTMSISRPRGIGDWLTEVVRAQVYDPTRGTFVLALARHVPPKTTLPILADLLDELPGYVAMAYAKIGGVSELNALESRQDSHDGWAKKEIKRAIQKIKARTSNTEE